MSTELGKKQFTEETSDVENNINIIDNINSLESITNNELSLENDGSMLENEIPEKEYDILDLSQLYKEVNDLLEAYSINKLIKPLKKIQDVVKIKIIESKEEHKELDKSSDEDIQNNQEFHSPWEKKFKDLFYNVKKQIDSFYKEKEKQLQINLEKRKLIIEELKDLYSNPSDSNQVMFRKFRDIKSKWNSTGAVSRKDFENIFKTYHHHLDNFYTYIKLNKELQNLDHAHNLEQRKSIINRAKELINEPNLFKSLNELQYLHKLWREEAEPVDEAHKETTWQEFKNITNIIHERKNEWFEQIKQEENQNYTKKIELINQIKSILEDSNQNTHKIWQNKIKEIETIRNNFINIGKVPREKTNEIWTLFKNILKDFNHNKNNFYRILKQEQTENLNKKNELIKIAKDNNNSEDWAKTIDLFKKIQISWGEIGHIPKKISDQKWFEFREACNYFFERYRNRFKQENEEFKQNLILKNSIISELELLANQEDTNDSKNILEKIKQINNQWNSIGKVPRENMNINKDFDRHIKNILDKLDISNHEKSEFSVNIQFEKIISNHDEKKLDEEIRKLKKRIQDLEQEISILDNNLSFFGKNADKNNPLVKDYFIKLDKKNIELNSLKEKYNSLIKLNFNSESE